MKHKHYEMIVAKAANMDLVVFAKSNGEWYIPTESDLMMFNNGHDDFFLCLPQHKEACLHWLNDGALQDFFEGSWTSVGDFEGEDWVEADNMFMNEEYQFRIKPKKEKRLISIYKDSVEFVNPDLAYPSCAQFIEIEVEV